MAVRNKSIEKCMLDKIYGSAQEGQKKYSLAEKIESK